MVLLPATLFPLQLLSQISKLLSDFSTCRLGPKVLKQKQQIEGLTQLPATVMTADI